MFAVNRGIKEKISAQMQVLHSYDAERPLRMLPPSGSVWGVGVYNGDPPCFSNLMNKEGVGHERSYTMLGKPVSTPVEAGLFAGGGDGFDGRRRAPQSF